MPRITIKEPGKTAQPYRFKTDRKLAKIGRGSDNDITLTAGSASTYHCKICRVEGGFILEDNQSTNGILVDGTRFQIIDLKDGMTVNIGDDIKMEFELGDEEIELLNEEDFVSLQRLMFPKSKKKDQSAKKPKVDKDDHDLDDEEQNDDDEYEEIVIKKKKKKKKKKTKRARYEDDDYDDDDDKPKFNTDSSDTPKARQVQAHEIPSAHVFASMFLFLFLAILCLFVGLALRHWQDYGNFIFSK